MTTYHLSAEEREAMRRAIRRSVTIVPETTTETIRRLTEEAEHYSHLWCEVRQHNDAIRTALRLLLANHADPEAVALAKWALGEAANG